jgi:hypothetical protein
MEIVNDKACFVQLWRKLERTRQLLAGQCKRYCIRNVLKVWFGVRATDEFIWQVCSRTVVGDDQVCGNDQLLPPSLYPRKHRELLRAIVATELNIGLRQVKLADLDAAYSIAFPNSTPINVNKKKRNGTNSTIKQ